MFSSRDVLKRVFKYKDAPRNHNNHGCKGLQGFIPVFWKRLREESHLAKRHPHDYVLLAVDIASRFMTRINP